MTNAANPGSTLLDATTTESNDPKYWGVILAGGDGRRLRALTRMIAGDNRPKQFCSIFGGQTLLEQTRRRIGLCLPEEQLLTVVTRTHERFYKTWQQANPRCRLLVQPENKGTAPAILLSLLKIRQLSPNATVAFFPSDHHISDDVRFMSYVDRAFSQAHIYPSMVVLLGIKPQSPEVHYGWIQPELSFSGEQSEAVSPVRTFWEKPSAIVARNLMSEGCLWNSFVMIGRAEAFIQLLRRALPKLSEQLSGVASRLGTGGERRALQKAYSSIDQTNFSSKVLAQWPNYLLVSQVSDVDWCDLGEPGRALSAIQKSGLEPVPLTDMAKIDPRASITYLRQYFETISIARRSEPTRHSVKSFAAGSD